MAVRKKSIVFAPVEMFFSRKMPVSAKVTALAALGLLAGIAMSWPLWNAEARMAFPALPVWGGCLGKGPLTGVGPAVLLVLPALSVAAFPGRKRPAAALAGVLLLLCCLDLNRLQPWVWFYLLVFATAILRKKNDDTGAANALRWLLAAVYFWGGFNKITPYFAEDNFPWFCEAFAFTKPAGQHPNLGYAVALLEMSFAAGLLWEKPRRYFRWIIPGFHGLIIVFLWKLNWNLVVIPWNAAMAGMVWVLNPGPDGRGNVASPLPPGPAAGLAWLAPLLHFFSLWPYPLCWEMYTNTQPEATFYTDKGRAACTREIDEMWTALSFDEGTKLLLDDWASKELHVPMFASENTFRRVGNYLCRCAGNRDSAGLYILTVCRWDRSAEKMTKIPCPALSDQQAQSTPLTK